jgi:pyruvate/2-oxoglutarate dehydrogenase complex dihydrolipoamide dehydrogenase (E3) component
MAARNACGHQAIVGNRAVPRPIYTEPEIASVGLTEAIRGAGLVALGRAIDVPNRNHLMAGRSGLTLPSG